MSCIRLFKLFLFLCSILSGVLFAIVLSQYELISNIHSPVGKNLAQTKEWSGQLDNSLQPLQYREWLRLKGFASEKIPHEELSYGPNRLQYQTEADYLFNQTKVLCLVLTTSRNRSRAMLNTWTKHCNDVGFYAKFSDSKNKKLTKIKLLDDSLVSSRTFCRVFVHLISKRTDFDWLLVTGDFTYAIVENLRHFLSPANASIPSYIGRPVHHYFLGVYNALDSGIVLSKASVNLLANGVFRSDADCVNINSNRVIYSGNFDAFVGMELAKHGIKPTNSLDMTENGAGSRFHPFKPEKLISPELISVFDTYWSSNVLPIKSGINCCSDKAITFTGFSPVTMYFIEYLLYHLTAFTELDGHKGIGNQQAYENYKVPSDMDRKIELQTKHKSRKRRKKNKHKNSESRKFSQLSML